MFFKRSVVLSKPILIKILFFLLKINVTGMAPSHSSLTFGIQLLEFGSFNTITCPGTLFFFKKGLSLESIIFGKSRLTIMNFTFCAESDFSASTKYGISSIQGLHHVAQKLTTYKVSLSVVNIGSKSENFTTGIVCASDLILNISIEQTTTIRFLNFIASKNIKCHDRVAMSMLK